MSTPHWFQSLFGPVNNFLGSFVTRTISNIATGLSPVVTQCLILYVILWGVAMWRGVIEEPFLDGVFRLIKIALVVTFATKTAMYVSVIANDIQQAPWYLIQLFAGISSRSTVPLMLDVAMKHALDFAGYLWSSSGTGFGSYFLAAIVFVVSALTLGYIAGLILLSLIAVSLLVAVGPVFILMLLFGATKRFFELWLGQVFNYVFVGALAMLAGTLIVGMLNNTAKNALAMAAGGQKIGLNSIVTICILGVLGFVVLMQVMGIASALGGGVALQTMGAGRWMAHKAGMPLRGARDIYRDINRRRLFRGKDTVGVTVAKAVWARATRRTNQVKAA